MNRNIFVADARRGDGRRYAVRGDEKLTAFVELQSALKALGTVLTFHREAAITLRRTRTNPDLNESIN
jgi:hypothetical protein